MSVLLPPEQFKTDTPWLIGREGGLSRAVFFSGSHSWAEALPGVRYMILLCEQRDHFIRGFLAAQLAGQTVLLPSNRSAGAISEIAADYPDSYCLVDDGRRFEGLRVIDCDALPTGTENGRDALPEIADDHVAALAFTSGSTGKARPNPKTWGSLVQGAHLARARFGFGPGHSIIATVPPQHMYGLETTVMVPLITGARIHSGRPFFPEDIRLALEVCDGQRVLITTPIHLRACSAAGLEWPVLEQIISATAPLAPALLAQAETTFGAPVREIYGCTEAGSLASRQPALGEEWQLYDTFSIREEQGEAIISAPHLDEEVPLADVVEITATDRFRLLGRKADLVNVAGKRASLADLNLKLNAIEGVEDGVFILPNEAADKDAGRLAALVVAPDLSTVQITEKLAACIDPVFLPRPLHKVAALPRNETGKLPRQALLDLLHQVAGRS